MNWEVLLPLILFLIVIFFIGVWSNRKMVKSSSFLSDYFLGSRELGGLVLAMTMVATYGSASSFLGGPGAAYTIGLGWVLLAMTQVATGYFVLLILGKKFAIVARRYKAVTLIDFLKERYQSKSVVLLSALSIIIFLFTAMAAQWVGGAYLIQSLTGLSYISATSIPGKTGREKTPIRCIFNIINPTTIVPIINARCIDLESRYDIARTATCGKPITPTPTRIQKDET